MKSLVRSILRRSGGSDVLRPDSQAHPPESESSETTQRVRLSKGHSVISSNDLRQSVLSEMRFKDLPRRENRSRRECSASEEEMGVEIEHC